jgi:hypothetical protein
MRKPRCWFYGDLAARFQGGGFPDCLVPDSGLGVSEGSFGGVEAVSDLGPCRGPRPTLQRATGHTVPGTSDSPIMTNWLSCRGTC